MATEAQQKKLNRLNNYIKKAQKNKRRSRGARKTQWSKNILKAQNQLKELRGTIQKEAGTVVKNPGGTGPVYRDSKGNVKKPPRSGAVKTKPIPRSKPKPRRPVPDGRGAEPRFRTHQFIDENRNGIDDRDEDGPVKQLPSKLKSMLTDEDLARLQQDQKVIRTTTLPPSEPSPQEMQKLQQLQQEAARVANRQTTQELRERTPQIISRSGLAPRPQQESVTQPRQKMGPRTQTAAAAPTTQKTAFTPQTSAPPPNPEGAFSKVWEGVKRGGEAVREAVTGPAGDTVVGAISAANPAVGGALKLGQEAIKQVSGASDYNQMVEDAMGGKMIGGIPQNQTGSPQTPTTPTAEEQQVVKEDSPPIDPNTGNIVGTDIRPDGSKAPTNKRSEASQVGFDASERAQRTRDPFLDRTTGADSLTGRAAAEREAASEQAYGGMGGPAPTRDDMGGQSIITGDTMNNPGQRVAETRRAVEEGYMDPVEGQERIDQIEEEDSAAELPPEEDIPIGTNPPEEPEPDVPTMEDLASGETGPAEGTKPPVEKVDDTILTSEEDIEQLDDYTDLTAPQATGPTAITAETGTAEEGTRAADTVATTVDAAIAEDLAPIEAAQGDRPDAAVVDDATLTERAVAAERDPRQEEAALARDQEFIMDKRSMIDPVTGEKIDVSSTPDAEAKARKAITGEEAPDGVEAVIRDTVGYEAAQRRKVKGTAAKSEAAGMIEQLGELPPDITASIVENPATVEAALDEQPVEVRAAVAALPTEALVSSQMEALLADMDEGQTPAWARPAVAAIEQRLAQRGLSASTVGRDALFNSIIQSAMPIAQSNAQALQTRAAQNLSNEQQANIEQSRQDMQRRMANLANRQQAGTQTAQMAQQMQVMQSQFTQDATMTSAQQQQQTRMQNLQNRQRSAEIRSQNEQQMALTNLGNEQQMEMANLQVEAERAGADQAAINQERMAEMQVAADFITKNAGFKQQMELANLSNDQQMRLANLSARNQAAAESLSNEQQTELANLNKTLETNMLQAKIAQDMGIAQLNVDQQRAVTNAKTIANIDMAKFDSKQQIELSNSKFMQTMTVTDFNARQQASLQNATAMAQLDFVNADNRTKLAITNASNFLKMDMANLSNRQQAKVMDAQLRQQRILSDQSSINAARQFNATSQNQTDQFNASMANQMEQFNVEQSNSMEKFNAAEKNKIAAVNAGNELDVEKFNTQISAQVDQFNENMDLNRDQWNAANRQAIEQSNTSWRRQANLVNTAAQNAVNQQNASNAFGMQTAALAAIWQQMRDEATFAFQGTENAEDRETQLYLASMSREGTNAEKSGDQMAQFINDFLSGLVGGE